MLLATCCVLLSICLLATFFASCYLTLAPYCLLLSTFYLLLATFKFLNATSCLFVEKVTCLSKPGKLVANLGLFPISDVAVNSGINTEEPAVPAWENQDLPECSSYYKRPGSLWLP